MQLYTEPTEVEAQPECELTWLELFGRVDLPEGFQALVLGALGLERKYLNAVYHPSHYQLVITYVTQRYGEESSLISKVNTGFNLLNLL